jgi:two-component system, OmpR family, sensor histidine kinase KdpD
MNLRGYLWGVGFVIMTTLLGELLNNIFGLTNITMIYLLSVVVTAVFWGLGPSILVSVLSVLGLDFFFIPPVLTFTVDQPQYIFTFIVLLVVGVTISYLASMVRKQSQLAGKRERQISDLYSLSEDLAVSTDLDAYIRAIVGRTEQMVSLKISVFLPESSGKELLKPFGNTADIPIDEKELAVASWSYQQGQIIGHGTDTLGKARARYFPMTTARGKVGVLAVWSDVGSRELLPEQERLLKAYADLSAVAIENMELAEKANKMEILEAKEKLQTAFLNSISHDLRTPLSSIIGAISGLQDQNSGLDDAARKNLVEIEHEEANRLNYMITNLLDMSRIEAGAVKLSLQPSDVSDLIGVAWQQLGSRAKDRQIKMNLAQGLPFLLVDFGLMVQTLVNILDNAIKYSSPDSTIEVTSCRANGGIEIAIADRGVGIPPQDLDRVFDKFYRVQRANDVPGIGLGLPICKGFVEAHDGSIRAENRPGGGTVIRLTLPVPESGPENGDNRA